MTTTNLKSMMVALGVLLSISVNAFTGEAEIDGINYKIVTKSKTAEVIQKSSGYSGDIVIPQTIVYEGVTCEVISINNDAFRWCKNIASVTIPNSITSIGESAFQECSGLTTLTIPNSVTDIGYYAFRNCSGLTSVNIGNSVKSISFEAFYGCSSLTSVIIPNSVTSLGRSAFQGCSSLESVTIPNSIKSIGSNGNGTAPAFGGCIALKNVYISDLEAWCKIEFHESEDNPLFYAHHLILNGKEIKDLVIPNNVTALGNYAFVNCDELESITISTGVESIGYYTFQNCSMIKEIHIPEGVKSIGKAFDNCAHLTTITLPSSLRSIAGFTNCPEIADVYCYARIYAEYDPYRGLHWFYPRDEGAFDGSYVEYATLHVHSSSLENAQNWKPWRSFGKIVVLSDDETLKCETPTISYTKGKLTFNSSTSGASCVSTITDADIKTHNGNDIDLTVTYNISVYATATGYIDSDVATATLCWIDSNPKTEGIANSVKEIKAMPVLIQSNEGVLTISSEDETKATPIKVYNTAGQMTASSSMTDGIATLKTNMKSGEIAIVKIGEKSVKVVVK